jgi:hypothetical protein
MPDLAVTGSLLRFVAQRKKERLSGPHPSAHENSGSIDAPPLFR